MKGITKIDLNQETIVAAVQKYFIDCVFDPSQIAKVVSIEPKQTYVDGISAWSYAVTVDSTVAAVEAK